MNLIRVAIPLILGLVVFEASWSALRRRRVYRWPDTIADFGCATMSQIVGLAVTALTVGAYAITADLLDTVRPKIPATPLTWVAVFLMVDLGQYALHRLSHRVSLLWACHAVHHSSEEFNLAVGLRNSSFHGFLLWMFFLPAAAIGVPWHMVAVCYGLNVLYQFWLHTRLVGRLGPLEYVLNTPSHHRVHHGINAPYLDRNYGGVLIVWDRLFGTFCEETGEPQYGTLAPVASWNPIWANVHGFALIQSAWQAAPDWRGKLHAVFGPPSSPTTKASPRPCPQPPSWSVIYVAIHLMGAILVTLLVVLPDNDPVLVRLTTGAFVLLTLGVMGGLLDGRRWGLRSEIVRLVMVAPLIMLLGTSTRLVVMVSALVVGSGVLVLRRVVYDRQPHGT